jgi:hypothetical protein
MRLRALDNIRCGYIFNYLDAFGIPEDQMRKIVGDTFGMSAKEPVIPKFQRYVDDEPTGGFKNSLREVARKLKSVGL